jgi:hypothetical protein
MKEDSIFEARIKGPQDAVWTYLQQIDIEQEWTF